MLVAKGWLSTHCQKLYWCANIGLDTEWLPKEKINTVLPEQWEDKLNETMNLLDRDTL